MSENNGYTFRNIVKATIAMRGERISEVAEKLETDGSTISNILSKRYSGKDKENQLADFSKEELGDLFRDILGELYKTHKADIDAFIDDLLDEHRNSN